MGKYYIAVDCEGVACAVGLPGIGLGNERNYQFAIGQAVNETNAAIRALFDAGAKHVTVWDAHGTGVNLDYHALDSRCDIVLGAGHKGRFVGLDTSYTAVLFIGYHAMEGTKDAVLAHTFSSKSYQYYKLAHRPAGELAIDGAWAGAYGVPVLFCCSDDLCIAEATSLFGPIATVQTKRSLSWTSAISRHPDVVCSDIYQTVLRAAQQGPVVPPYTLPSPLPVEIRFQRMDQASSATLVDTNGQPFSFIDAYTRKGVVHSVLDLF